MLPSQTPRYWRIALSVSQIGAGFRGGAQVGLADDFQQRHAGAIEIDEARVAMGVVDIFAGVFFHVDARQAHALRRAVQLDVDVAAGADRQLVLANLIALGQIRIKVILAGENARPRDFAMGRQTGFDGEFDDSFVQHRQNAGKTGAHRASVLRWARWPNWVEQPQKIFDSVSSWAWTSRPMTLSYFMASIS